MTKTKPMQRVLSVVALLALALTTLVVPAFAAEPSATATLDVAEDALVPAGQPHLYSLTVRNTGVTATGVNALLGSTSDPSIDAVVVTVPDYFAEFQTTNAVPDGWESALLSNNRLIMRRGLDQDGNPTGQAIAPSESFTFQVQTNVEPQEFDDGARFAVAVSADRGRNLEAAAVAPGGTLDSAVKILEILNITIDAPVGATDATVTDGQDNVFVSTTVQSYSSAALDIAPSITNNGGSTVATTLQSGNTSLPAGGNETYTFLTSFDGVGDAVLNAAVTGSVQGDERAAAVGTEDLDIDVTVQRATAFAYRAAETATVSLGAAELSAIFDKTGVPSGSVTTGVTLTGPTGATKNAVVAANPLDYGNDATTESVSFSTSFSTADAEGLYDATFTFAGTDDNGAAVDLTVSVDDILNLDATLPVLQVQVELPDGSAVDDEVAAAGNGRRLRIVGDVFDGGVKCGGCALTYTITAGSAIVGAADRALTNNSGDFDTTITLDGLPLTVQNGLLKVTVKARDVAGNGPSTGSANTIFDTKKAAIEDSFPVTGGVGEYTGGDVVTDRIDVIFAEGIDVPFRSLPAQWSVTGNRVDSVEILALTTDEAFTVQRIDRSGTNANIVKTYNSGQRIWVARLDLNTALGGNELPTVTFDPDANAAGSGVVTGSQSRIFDRVNLNTVKGARQAFDNIAPALPELVAVDGQGQYFDDAGVKTFWSKGGEAILTIANVDAGSTVQVFQDGQMIAEQDNTAAGTSTILVEANLGATEGPVTIELKALDSGVKTSDLRSHGVVIDTTAPVALGATREGVKVTINADDILVSGPEADLEFVVLATDSRGRSVTLNVVDVARPAGAEGDPSTMDFDSFKKLTSRVLTFDPAGRDLSTLTFTSVEYQGQFGPDEVYKDRAGNALNSPSTFSFS